MRDILSTWAGKNRGHYAEAQWMQFTALEAFILFFCDSSVVMKN